MGENTSQKTNKIRVLHNYSQQLRKEEKSITTEKLVTELYLAKFDYLASLTSFHCYKNLKDKGIQDDQMLSSVELKFEILMKTESIFKAAQSV